MFSADGKGIFNAPEDPLILLAPSRRAARVRTSETEGESPRTLFNNFGDHADLAFAPLVLSVWNVELLFID